MRKVGLREEEMGWGAGLDVGIDENYVRRSIG